MCGWSYHRALRLLESYLQGLRPGPPNSVVTRASSVASRKANGQVWNPEAQFGFTSPNRTVRVDGKGCRISSGRMWPLHPGCGWVLEKGV